MYESKQSGKHFKRESKSTSYIPQFKVIPKYVKKLANHLLLEQNVIITNFIALGHYMEVHMTFVLNPSNNNNFHLQALQIFS